MIIEITTAIFFFYFSRITCWCCSIFGIYSYIWLFCALVLGSFNNCLANVKVISS